MPSRPAADLAADIWRQVIDEDPGLHDLEPETVRRIASAVLKKAADVALPRDRASRRPMLYEQVQHWLHGVADEFGAPPSPNEPRSTQCVECSHGAVWHLLGSMKDTGKSDPSCKFSGCECPGWWTESDKQRARELLDRARICMISTHTGDDCTCRPAGES